MTDRSSQHWYPTAAYLYTLHLDGPALAWEYLRRKLLPARLATPASQFDAAQAWGLRLLEDPAWMRATHILLGSPITMPWCSYTPTPTHHPMRIPSSSGAFLGASN